MQEPVRVPGGPIALRARELPVGYSKAPAPLDTIKWSAKATSQMERRLVHRINAEHHKAYAIRPLRCSEFEALR